MKNNQKNTETEKTSILREDFLETLKQIADGTCKNLPLDRVMNAFRAAGAKVKKSEVNLSIQTDDNKPPQVFHGMGVSEITLHSKENSFSETAQRMIDRCAIPTTPDGQQPSVH